MYWNEIFVYYCMIPIAWVMASVGNILGLIVFSKKSMIKIGPVYAYRILFLSDQFFLPLFINSFTTQAFGKELIIYSDIGCKIYYFLNYATVNWGPMMIVYISAEKLVSIRYPAKRFLLRKKKSQIIYFIIIIIFYALINIPSLFYYEIKTNEILNLNQTIATYKTCTYKDSFSQQLLSLVYLFTKVLIPFSLMTTCSVFLIISVFKLRQRIIRNFLSTTNQLQSDAINKYKKDFRLAVTSLLMNLIYLVLNAPLPIFLSLLNSLNNYYFLWVVVNLCYFSFSVNFYLILLTNHLTRKEFFNIFKK